jgi:ATP-binding cassette subfamily B protein
MKNSEVLRKTFQYVGRYRSSVLAIILLSLVGVGCEVARPLPVKYIIDNVLAGQPLPPFLEQATRQLTGGSAKTQLLVLLTVATIAFIISAAGISLLVSHFTTKVCQRLVHDLSLDVFDKLQQLSLAFYSQNKLGELMQRVSGDVYVVYQLVAQIMIPVITSLASLLAMFYVMARINLLLACLAIAVVPALGLLLFFFNKPMSDSTVDEYSLLGQLSAFLQQSLSSIKIIQAYTQESYTKDRFENHSLEYSKSYVLSTRISTTYVVLTGVVTSIVGAGVVGLGAYKGLKGQISIGDLFVFLGYISALFGPVNSLSTTVGTAVKLGARGRRIFEILASNDVIHDAPTAHEIEHLHGEVEFRHVTFGYGPVGGAAPILNDFNLKVQPGQVVAIVGPTGAGKTSIISLLLRFYDPWQGEVLLDGQPLPSITLHSLRNNVSLVLQDSFIFPVSLAENIAFGNPEATLAEIIEAAKTAQAHDFIMRLPHGYQTVASEAGVSLSGGEKQRISLARAFLRKTPILILDEPTSALDVQTETKIFQELAAYSKGKTVFIVSHRLSTIRQADLIITIKDGILAEQGTHEELLKLGNVYANLYKFQ